MAGPDQTSPFARAVALHRDGRIAEARAAYTHFIENDPNDFQALYMLGVLEVQTRNLPRAVEMLTRAAALAPMNAPIHSNAAIALNESDRPAEALQFFDHAASLEPDNADIQYNRANVLWAMERMREAAEGYERTVALRPDYAEAHFNLGNIYTTRGQQEAAVASYAAAARARPDLDFVQGMLLHTRMHIADWHGFDAALQGIVEGVARGARVCQPFVLLALTDSPELHQHASAIWAQSLRTAAQEKPPAAPKAGKIRIAYFSMDFRAHPTTTLTADMYRLHDRDRFDVLAFSYGPRTGDPFRVQLEQSFDMFFDVHGASDAYIRGLAREQGIDIAIDLAGYTSGARPTILTGRVAPVQVNYLGFAGTMGAAHIDYIIADRVLIPDKRFYSEKVAFLPGSYQPNADTRVIADVVLTRSDVGLPPDAFVFCCFNATYKITPSTFDGWMRILRAVDGSVLWLLVDNVNAAANLRREVAARGIDPARVVMAPKMLRPEHIARHRLADLFLDTLPYNAHTTGSDALWAGLPVLTCAGRSFPARVGASLLTAVGLPELITASQEEFEETAIALAHDPARLALLRAKLAVARTRAPLFNILTLTRQIESAYVTMAERARAGLPPVHIQVPD